MRNYTLYKGYKIETDETPMGLCYLVQRDDEERGWQMGCWSMPQAKAAIRRDIKQRKCDHSTHGRTTSRDGRYEYCAGCDKTMRRIMHKTAKD